MKRIIPGKLKRGDKVAIIAPAFSLSVVPENVISIANRRLNDLGFDIELSAHALECDNAASSPIKRRVDDIHWAFKNPEIKAILTAIGGTNSNELLEYLDWKIIKDNPKIFCGYSDITALNNAILKKTGLVTYSGPHYSTFGQEKYFEYTLDYFIKCCFRKESIKIVPSKKWSDDEWWINQDKRKQFVNSGPVVINKGVAQGTVIGGNLSTFQLLKGTEYMPGFHDAILFLEEEGPYSLLNLDREVRSLIHLPGFSGIRGLVLGRFQKSSDITPAKIARILKIMPELSGIPIVANADFGHTSPMFTFPIGGEVKLTVKDQSRIDIIVH